MLKLLLFSVCTTLTVACSVKDSKLAVDGSLKQSSVAFTHSSSILTFLKDTILISSNSTGIPIGVSSPRGIQGDSSSVGQRLSGALSSSTIKITTISSSIYDSSISSFSVSTSSSLSSSSSSSSSSFQRSSSESSSSSIEQSSSLPIESSSNGVLSSSEHASCQSAPSSSSSSSESSSSAAPASPEAHNVCITGTHSVGSVLRGTYTYSDVNRDLEGDSQYQWYRNDTALIGETDTTHTLQSEDLGNLLSFSVIPSAQSGTPTIGIKSIVYDTIYFENHAEANALLDSRDGEEYDIVYIGLQIWMAENLRYMVDSVSHRGDGSEDTGSAGRYYYVLGYDPVGSTHAEQLDSAKRTENFKRYGVLYNLYAAEERTSAYRGNFNPSGFRGACPLFWHLPSDKEWEVFATYVGSKTVGAAKNQQGNWSEIGKQLRADSTLWDGDNLHTDAFNFNALPGGFREDAPSIPEPLYEKYAKWWSSTLLRKRTIANDIDGLYNTFNLYDEDAGLSVRCVKD